MSGSFVQGAGGVPGDAFATFAAAVTPGNTLVCGFRAGANPTTLTVSDSVNGPNTPWTEVRKQGQTFDGHSTSIFIFENTVAGTPRVNVASSGGGTLRMVIAELAGLATSGSLIGVNSAEFGSPGVWSSGSVPGISPGDVLVGVGSTDGNVAASWVAATSGGAWTIEVVYDANGRVMLEILVPAAGGTFAHDPDTTSPSFSNGTSLIAALRQPSAGPAAPPPLDWSQFPKKAWLNI